MIDYLNWDSNFFGHKIGKFTYTEGEDKWPDIECFEAFDLVYIFSSTKLNLNYPLFDIKLTFHKLTENKSFPESVCVYDGAKHDYDDLLELVYLSGHDSRFRKDSFFGEEAFQKLYKTWIDKSILATSPKVLVEVEHGKILGFIAIKQEANQAFIELVAVAPEAQGKGVGLKLINTVESLVGPSVDLYVPTQQTNQLACRFYSKCGFKISDKQYIYHYATHTLQ
jgi:dTDP-4-amino-4,6-dideoxy-D-galactose acyltransferase